jgi:hypothetical protein
VDHSDFTFRVKQFKKAGLFDPEDEGITNCQNISNYLPMNMA